MRTIKFRVINGSVICAIEELTPSGWIHRLLNNGVDYIGCFNEYEFGHSSGLIRNQFTGLHDKHGKEIYEGDIIAWDYEYDSDYDGDMPIVKRSAGRAQVKDIFDTWQIKEAARESKGVEVVGNIYSNPELILNK